jgi:hypothetical protein
LNSSSCSSSSPTLAARRSRNARCAARFWALRFVGGVSVAGFRPGLGRGGITHSRVVMDILGVGCAVGVVGSGLTTEAIDILLIGAFGGEAADCGAGTRFARTEGRSGTLAVAGSALTASWGWGEVAGGVDVVE